MPGDPQAFINENKDKDIDGAHLGILHSIVADRQPLSSKLEMVRKCVYDFCWMTITINSSTWCVSTNLTRICNLRKVIAGAKSPRAGGREGEASNAEPWGEEVSH